VFGLTVDIHFCGIEEAGHIQVELDYLAALVLPEPAVNTGVELEVVQVLDLPDALGSHFGRPFFQSYYLDAIDHSADLPNPKCLQPHQRYHLGNDQFIRTVNFPGS
jgi:hypothetical protein